MSLIDNTYFVNDISMPDSVLSLNSNFELDIARYEPDVLANLLGYELYKALLADLDGSGLPQSDRFKDLINGKEFSFELGSYTISTKWEGLVNTDKISLVSYYVYHMYRRDNDSFFSVGQLDPATENSTKVSNMAKLSDIWNKMVELYGNGYFMPYDCKLDNTTYEHLNTLPSAYNFLLANIDDYPEWIFKPQYKTNQFGI